MTSSKNEFIFYKRNSRLSRSVQCASGSENVLRLNMQWYRSIPNGNTKICRRRSGSLDNTELGHFTLLFAEDNKKKCTKISDARAQLLLCSLNLLFSNVLVAVVVVVVCFSSLKSTGQRQEQYKGVADDFLVLFGQIKRSKRKYILHVILYNASFLGLLLFYSATSSGTQYS